MASKIGLVLTGGGARAAYQAGVLKGISEVLGNSISHNPFPIITGISAGAINGATLATHAQNFKSAVEGLCEVWSGLISSQIMNTNVGSLSRLGVRWMRDLSLGGLLGHTRSTHLLDVSPLRTFLAKNVSFDSIYQNLDKGFIDGIGVSATNYATGTAITFFDGDSKIEAWTRSSRMGFRQKLSLEHVLASASIPILFPPVAINDSFYGDGSIRLSSPLSPAIHMGAEKVLAIGIRHHRALEVTRNLNQTQKMDRITVADIGGVMLNATFFDTLDADVERMHRINQTIALMTPEQRAKHPQNLREIPLLVIYPSKDLGSLASEQFKHFPQMLRFLLSGLGASNEKGWDLLSYLAFDSAYTNLLIDLGYGDALNMKTALEEFFGDAHKLR